MRIAILSRGKTLHSVRRLLAEAKKLRIECDVINPLDCQLIVNGKDSQLLSNATEIPRYDAILPRIGASITDYGIAVVRQFETLGMHTVNGSTAIAESRDKMRCLQVLAQYGLKVPASALTRSPRSLRRCVEAVNGLPVVLKTLRGTQGTGVMLMHTPISVSSVLDTLGGLEQDVIIQQFIAEGAGRDYRAFVVGDKVVAAMMRTAAEGEFRANIHRGGEGKLVKLPRSYHRAAVRAAQVLKLQIAGVDIMAGRDGPMILEVNSSPGFEGIEKATGLNIAGQIVRHISREARKAKRRDAARKARAKAQRGRKKARRPKRRRSARLARGSRARR